MTTVTAEKVSVEIRPFCDDDRAAVVALWNQTAPPYLQETVAEWVRGDAQRPPEEVRLRLCIGTPPVAYLSIVDRSTSAWRIEGVCSFGLWVDAAHQRKGLGSALYEQALAFASERGAQRMKTSFRLSRPDEPAAAFLMKRGFVEIEREVPSKLDLTEWDSARPAMPQIAGVRLRSYAEAGDTDAHRRKLWALDRALHPDIPTHDVRPEMPPFEQWIKKLEEPEWDPNAAIVAENDAGDWIGLSLLGFQEGTGIGWTFMTGVLPAYRGQGLALAMKLRTIDAAWARGCTLILTENHEDNAPMRAINHKLGFVPDAPGVSYAQNLTEEAAHAAGNAETVL